jgi:nucleoside-triphosphatase THEP1
MSAKKLAFLFPGRSKMPELIILSGPTGAGKSAWCRRLVDAARAEDLVVAGLISPPVFSRSNKIAIGLMDLTSGESRRLAERRPLDELKKGPSKGSGKASARDPFQGITTRLWRLDPEVLAWGNRRLLSLPPHDCLILDELGPLELLHDQGLRAGPTLIDSRSTPLTCVVIRPSLLPLAQERWPWGQVLSLPEWVP